MSQMPWASNIANTRRQTGNTSLFTREMLTAVARDQSVQFGFSARFPKFAFDLFCYVTNHLITGPEGNSEFCPAKISIFPETKCYMQLILWCKNIAVFCFQEMGIPFNNLICASNENNILTDFFHTGSYDMGKRHLHQTVSPSIDILKSSNLERLLYHVTGNSGEVVAGLMRSLEENKRFKVSNW